MKLTNTKRILFAGIAIACLPTLALAHPGHIGFAHPFSGLDHLLAMLGVGFLAAQTDIHKGNRTIWALPLTFVCTMIVGGILGFERTCIPWIETGILGSVFILGLMIVFPRRLPTIMTYFLIALFALCHGHAHGSELPMTAGFEWYSAGFICATALLHIGGVLLCRFMQRYCRLAIPASGLAMVASTFWM